MRRTLAVTTFLLLTTGRLGDIAVTLYFDPSLKREGNPVVSLFRGGLASLVLATGFVWLISTTFLFLYWRGESVRVTAKPKRFSFFVRNWINVVVLTRRPLVQSLPGGSNWHEGLQAMRFVGLALSWAIIFGSFAAIHAWFATSGPRSTYQMMYSALRVGGWNYFVWLSAAIGLLFGGLLFFWSEFREQRVRARR